MLLTRNALALRSISYLVLVLLTAVVIAASAAFFLSQAVRSSPHRSWKNNFDAVVIGAAYAIVVCFHLLLRQCTFLERRYFSSSRLWHSA